MSTPADGTTPVPTDTPEVHYNPFDLLGRDGDAGFDVVAFNIYSDPAHQINMGLVRCDDPGHGYTAGERWPEVDDRVAASNCNIVQLIEAKTGL